jgi:hypothetical protein
MTSFPNITVSAAACAFAAGTAVAQSYEAEIPFAFRAGRVKMTPGRYQIWIDPWFAASMIRLHNLDARETLLLRPVGIDGAGHKGEGVKLRFHDGDSPCVLTSLLVGGYRGAYSFHTPGFGPDERAHTAEIELAPVNVG